MPIITNKQLTETAELIKNILADYSNNLGLGNDENSWYSNLKEIGNKYNFATDNKLYKQNPDAFIGNMNDLCEIIRVIVSGRKITPNLFAILTILGEEEIKFRINNFLSK